MYTDIPGVNSEVVTLQTSFQKFDNQVPIWITVHRFTFAYFIPFFHPHCCAWKEVSILLWMKPKRRYLRLHGNIQAIVVWLMIQAKMINVMIGLTTTPKRLLFSSFCIECDVSIVLQNLFGDVCGLSLKKQFGPFLFGTHKKKSFNLYHIQFHRFRWIGKNFWCFCDSLKNQTTHIKL